MPPSSPAAGGPTERTRPEARESSVDGRTPGNPIRWVSHDLAAGRRTALAATPSDVLPERRRTCAPNDDNVARQTRTDRHVGVRSRSRLWRTPRCVTYWAWFSVPRSAIVLLAAVHLEAQDGLAVDVEIASRHEPEPLVERCRAAVEVEEAAGEQLPRARLADELSHDAYRLSSVAPALIAVVDQQLPQKPRADDLRRPGNAVPADHDEADRLLADVDRPIPRVGLRVVGGIGEGAGDGADERQLLRENAQGQHQGADVAVQEHLLALVQVGARVGPPTRRTYLFRGK